MNRTDLEQLPEKVTAGKMSVTEAINKLWEDIYFNPEKYGLYLTEDQKSDFLLSMRSNLEYIFKKFDPLKSSFYTFLCGCIKQYVSTWCYNDLQKGIKLQCTEALMRVTTEEMAKENSRIKFDDECDISMFEGNRHLEHLGKKKLEIARKAVLILLLKSCNEVSDSLIRKTARFIGEEEDALIALIEKLRELTVKKREKLETLIYRRNKAFYFQQKYRFELENLDENSRRYESIKRKYERKTKSWKKQIALLKNVSLSSPANLLIAKTMNLPPRRISFYLNHARRKKIIFPDFMQNSRKKTD